VRYNDQFHEQQLKIIWIFHLLKQFSGPSRSPHQNECPRLLRTSRGKKRALKWPLFALWFCKDNLFHHVYSTHQALVVWKLAQAQTAGPRYICGWRTIYSYFTSNANRWVPGHMFSSIKYEHFVQVSSNQKHIFIMFADIRCGQESISKQPWYMSPAAMVVLPAVTHAFRRVRKWDQPAVTMWLIVSSHCISLGAVSNVMWIKHHSKMFLPT